MANDDFRMGRGVSKVSGEEGEISIAEFDRPESAAPRKPARKRYDRTLLRDLIDLLEANPRGLRRWSVMRGLRTRRERAGHEITMKFEDEVEHLFREHCMSEPPRENETRPFYKPKDKAGEVWAVDSARLTAFREREREAG